MRGQGANSQRQRFGKDGNLKGWKNNGCRGCSGPVLSSGEWLTREDPELPVEEFDRLNLSLFFAKTVIGSPGRILMVPLGMISSPPVVP
jgi:hypothetical protein